MNKLFFATISLLACFSMSCMTEKKGNVDGGTDENGEIAGVSPYAKQVGNFDNKSAALNWSATLDNPYYLPDVGKKTVYLYIDLTGGAGSNIEKRPPLNLSLVLDKSGSMKGEKLSNAKKAMDYVVDQLDENDYLSLVQYGSDVQVLHPSKEVTSKSLLHNKIQAINESGSTNLCGGLQEGYAQAKTTSKTGFVNRVLLLSDGLVNVGITNPDQIVQIAKNTFRDKGIATSTFGVGADYNENLMTDIADNAGANYYFIGNPNEIAGIFSKELKGLLSVVAQNTMLKVKIPAQNFKVTKVYGYPHTLFGDEVLVNLNDVFAKEEKSLLIELEMTSPVRNDVFFDCELKYADAGAQGRINTETKQIRLEVIQNKDKYERSFDEKVQESIVLFRSTEMFDQALEEADNGNYDKAKELSSQTKDYLQKNMTEKPSPRLKKQSESVTDYENKVTTMPTATKADQQMMQKAGKNANYESKKGK